MGPARNSDPLSFSSKQGDESRRAGRLRCQSIKCSLGQVVDLSGTGLRVQCKGRPDVPVNEPFGLTINAPTGMFTAPVTAVWVRKVGFCTYEIGLRFGELSDDAKRQLAVIARDAATNVTYYRAG